MGGEDLTLAEVHSIMSHIRSIAPPDARFCLGATVDGEFSKKLAVMVLLSGIRHDTRATESASERSPVVAAAAPAPRAPAQAPRKGSRQRRRARQGQLDLAATDKGRFKNVEPTVYDGEDLDIPTFIRRGIKLSTDE